MNNKESKHVTERRRVLRAALSGAALLLVRDATCAADGITSATARAGRPEASHFPFGPVLPPRLLPAIQVLTHEGVSTDLAALLRGRVTALQLMFTGCSATCPIQGALFAQAQQALHGRWRSPTPAQLLSLTIDPIADGPSQLAGWLRKFEARPGWLAAAPRADDMERLIGMLGTGGESRPSDPDPHTGQVYIVNPKAELVFRTPSLPASAKIVEALNSYP